MIHLFELIQNHSLHIQLFVHVRDRRCIFQDFASFSAVTAVLSLNHKLIILTMIELDPYSDHSLSCYRYFVDRLFITAPRKSTHMSHSADQQFSSVSREDVRFGPLFGHGGWVVHRLINCPLAGTNPFAIKANVSRHWYIPQQYSGNRPGDWDRVCVCVCHQGYHVEPCGRRYCTDKLSS